MTAELVAAAVDAAPRTETGAQIIVEVADPHAKQQLLAWPGVEQNLEITDDLIAVSVSDQTVLTDLAAAGQLKSVMPDERLVAFYPSDPEWSFDCSGHQTVAASSCGSVPGGSEPGWASTVWRDTAGARDVTIAVIDGGIDTSHPDLAGRVVPRFSYLPWPMERETTHGTLVSLIAAGLGGNGVASAGVAWDATIYSYEVLGRCQGLSCGTTGGLLNAIYLAANDGADVINLSLGYESPVAAELVKALQDAIDFARSRGSIIVAAAGNDSLVNVDVYPAANTGVIGVAAVTPTGAPELFTNRSDAWVDISAPNEIFLGGTFRAGTSFAAPRVAGLIALMHSYNPAITEAEALAILQSTARPINGNAAGMGAGIANGPAAIAALQTPAVCGSMTSGYVLDGWGGLHRAGAGQPHPVRGGSYWPGWDIARGVALLPDDAGGYVVDGWGGLHPFAIAGNPTPPRASGSPYWPGWDIVRDIAILPDGTGGYVLDGWGGMHPFAIGNNPPPPKPLGGPYWPGWDIARGVTLTNDGGYVVDGWGGIHRFNLPGRPTPPPVVSSPYWTGWDIVRGITLNPSSTAGYVVDGWGGLHPFSAGGSALPRYRNAPYWVGWDIVEGVASRAVCD